MTQDELDRQQEALNVRAAEILSAQAIAYQETQAKKGIDINIVEAVKAIQASDTDPRALKFQAARAKRGHHITIRQALNFVRHFDKSPAKRLTV